MATQETGSQTVFLNNEFNSYEPTLLTPPPPPPPPSPLRLANIQKTSTSTSTNFPTEDFSCLDAGTSTYLDMYLSDISTQTQLTSSQNVQFNIEQDLVNNFYYLEEPHRSQNSNYINNLVHTKSFKDMSTNSDHHNSNHNDRESMTTPTNSSIFSNSTCQTENFYFEGVNLNTNSIQTQTSSNTYLNCNNHVVDTITQTEWTN